MRSLPRRSCALLLLAASLGACTTWQAQNGPLPEGQRPVDVRLTLNDGSVVVLEDATVGGGSIRSGHGPGNGIALSQVRRVEVRRTDGAMTALAVGGGLLAVGVAALLAGGGSGY